MARFAAGETLRPYVFLHPLGERASAGWLTDGAEAAALDVALVDEAPERAARLLASSLREGGLGYAVVGARGRARLQAELARVGLTAGPTFLVRPAPWDAERLLAPDTAVLAEALGRRPGIARALRRIPFPGRVPALGATVVTVHRPGEPVGAWLRELVPAAEPRRLLVASVQAGRGLVVVWPTHGREPIAYVKLGEVGREGGALGELAVGAARAGVRVPRVLGRSEGVLAVEALPGRRASWVLAERPGRLPEVAGAVADALVRWHDAVAVERPLAADDVERHLLRPARALAHVLAPGYAERLEREARALLGRPLPFSVSHGDLTMANVLLGDGPPAFLDWEAASADMLPFVDLPYALADAAAARERYADRPAAFGACFEAGGAERDLAAGLLARAAAARGTSREALRLSFHACWLRHAVDDLGKGAGDAPFVQIAAHLSATPELFDSVPA